MRHAFTSSLWFALLTLGCAPAPPAKPDSVEVFREIRFRGGAIELGKPLPPALSTPFLGDTIVAVPARLVEGADAIRAHLTAAGLVRKLHFEYRLGADYDAMVADYVATLGPPRKEPFRTGERAVWEDALTRFELVRDPERSAGVVYSVLTDRAVVR